MILDFFIYLFASETYISFKISTAMRLRLRVTQCTVGNRVLAQDSNDKLDWLKTNRLDFTLLIL